MQPFDLWDQAQITGLTRRAVDRVLGNETRIANQFAPLTGTRLEKIGKGSVKLRAVGKARGAIADDATPPIFRPEMRFVEEAFSLLRLGEMTPVEESLRRALENNGTDADSQGRRDRAGVDIITRARTLQIRQENLSDYYVMQAIINGQLQVDVANPPVGTDMHDYAIDYEFPVGHLITVATSFASIATSTPVTYLRAIQEQTKRSSGEYAIHFWMSSEVMNYILTSTQVRDSFNWNATGNTAFTATQEMLKQLLYEPERIQFHVTDEGWYEEAAAYNIELDADQTRWVPKDRIIAHTVNPYRGENIAEMFDGMVPVQTDWNKYDYRGPGAQSYVQLIQGNLTLMWRQEARRLPMIHHPECIVSAKVVL